MLEILPQDKFYDLHAFHIAQRRRIRNSRLALTNRDIYLKKKYSRLTRAQGLKQSEAAKQLFEWIFSIQAALKLTNIQFAKRICKNGGQASPQTLKLWRNNHGHLPSERNFKALLILDREAKIGKEELKIIFGVTTTELIEKK